MFSFLLYNAFLAGATYSLENTVLEFALMLKQFFFFFASFNLSVCEGFVMYIFYVFQSIPGPFPCKAISKILWRTTHTG